jgi:hypothetical protein
MSDLLNEALDERRELRREVERLRELLRIARAMRDTAGAQREDAWREVRRMRELRAERDEVGAELARLRIENARLREALAIVWSLTGGDEVDDVLPSGMDFEGTVMLVRKRVGTALREDVCSGRCTAGECASCRAAALGEGARDE